ncbi:MAG: ABC transporter substrate-binding protein [Xanthobacteraceae bacterium]|nr:ABC transporter substrate-binding protein [Xanthobacteraceae bacterium]
MTRRTALLAGAAAVAAPLIGPRIARAQERPTVRLTTGWTFQGNHSYMLHAQRAGYFASAGVNVAVSRGFGSARTPVDIAGGVFDLGFSDVPSAVKFLSENPNADVIIVAILEDTTQTAMTVLADGPVKKPKDIEGHSLAAPESDLGRLLFPSYARLAGIDAGKVTWISVAPELREPTLVQKRAMGITGNPSATALNLKRIGIDLPKQRIFFYRDAGLDLFSSCFVASRRFCERNPAAMKAALAGLFRAYVEYYRDPTEALKTLVAVEPLTDVKVETERVAYLKALLPIGKYMKENGVSSIEPARLEACIRVLETAYSLPTKLPLDRVYTDAYLPPASQRMI